MRARVLAAALLLALGASATGARAATCRLQGEGQWGPIGTYTGPSSCAVLHASDHFIVEGQVEVVADLVQATAPPAGIVVAAGGSLQIWIGAGPRRIVLGSLGLTCLPGSLCDLEGAFRTPRASAGAGPGGLIAAFSGESLWSFGAPIPCPGWDASQALWQPDCAGTLQDAGDRPGSDTVLGGYYPGPADPDLVLSLDAMEPGEVWYFTDPDPSDPDAPPESGFHYEIVEARGEQAPGGPAGGYVQLDVRQGLADNGYPQARRRILACEIAAPVAARSRELFTDAGCIDRDFERDGHWIRFERNGVAFAACPGTAAAPCEAESRVWRIQASHDDVPCPGGGNSCDRFTIADLRGFQSPRDSGGVVWISQVGAGEGDAGALLVPTRIGSASPPANEASEGDSEVTLQGESWVRKAVFDHTGNVYVGGNSALVGAFEDVFLSSVSSSGQNPLYFFGPADEIALRRVSLIGGEEFDLEGTGGGGDDHGIAFLDPAHELDVILEDVSVRYTWDDLIVTSVAQPPASLVARRVRVQFEGETDQSQAGIDVGSAQTQVSIEDFECVDCADSNRPISLATGISGAVRRVLFLAPKSDLAVRLLGPVEDLTAIGARNAEGIQLAEGNLRRCVLRDNLSISSAAMISDADGTDVSQCVFRDNAVSLDFVFGGSGSIDLWIRDTVFLDNWDANAVGNGDDVIDCRSITGPAGSCRIERTTVAYSTTQQGDPTNFRTGIRATAGSDGREVELSEVVLLGLVEGFRVSAPASAELDHLCFDQNALDAPAAHLAQVDDPAWGPLDLRDPALGAFDPLPDGVADTHPCGIRRGQAAPGVCQRSWVHAINALEPECMAPACSNGADDDFDGLRDHPEDPSCASPEADDEGALPACGDGLDNDGDGLVDLDDPGCPHAGLGPEDPACDDGIDNDDDLLVDFADPGCRPDWPYQEESQRPTCGLGPEAAGLLAALLALRRRRRGASRT